MHIIPSQCNFKIIIYIMEIYIIHFIHVVCSLLLVNYPFLVKKNPLYDFIYIVLLFILLYSYIIFKGECFISYAIKKYENPSYVMGSNLSVLNDYSYIFKNTTIASYVIFYIITTLFITSFIVLKRYNFINIRYIYLFTVLSIIYFILLKIKPVSSYSFYFNMIYMFYITFLLYRVLTKKYN
jgi:hypothetical protein